VGDSIISQRGHLLTGGANRLPAAERVSSGFFPALVAPPLPANVVALAQRPQEMAVSSLARSASVRS